MTTPLLLFLAFLLAGWVAPAVLGRARWPYRAPRLGVAAWLIAAATAALAAVLAAATVAVPASVAGHGLADWWHACLGQWQHYYGDSNLIGVGLAAAATVAMVASVARSIVAYARGVLRVRRTQRAGLALLSRSDDRSLVIVPHPVPTAYCVPGRPGRIVMTDSAMRALEPDQVEAVVAHERAHLAGRHALLVGLATVLQSGLGWVCPVFRAATRETGALVEMIADDAATRRCAPPRVIQALIVLADGPAPRTVLAAGGSHLVRRIRRLTTPPKPLGYAPRVAAALALAVGMLAPIATVAGPVAVAVIAATCAQSGHVD